MRKADVLLGLQWGDEGKGKVVDVLTPEYDAIARFQGGPNAGHTLEFNHEKHILHTIPSGIFHPDCLNLIGNGLVIDPVVFMEEAERLAAAGARVRENLVISVKAHLILPTHRLLDAASEQAKGNDKIGSTLKGIGPVYTDKTAREGLRTGDIQRDDFESIYRVHRDRHLAQLQQSDLSYDLEQLEKEWFEAIYYMRSFKMGHTDYLANNLLKDDKKILAEGAQGTLLDIDFGSYPFVTSSNTSCGGLCTGLGIPPNKVGRVIGISKAYCTRVGSGPFPTEQTDKTGIRLREQGHEFGSTTGRPRRCGWLDLVALRYAIMLNGVTELVITKADVLSGFDVLKIATSYRVNDELTDQVPYDLTSVSEPVYQEFPGWTSDISQIRHAHELPHEMKEYLRFIELHTGVPITLVSVGPDRAAMIRLTD